MRRPDPTGGRGATAVLSADGDPSPSAGRDAFRAFVTDVVAPTAGSNDQRQSIPRDLLDEVAAAGYWGAVLPVDAGGMGLDNVTLGILHEEIGRGCSSLRSLLTVHTMASVAVLRWAGEQARERWLAPLASGAALGAFALTEPEIGSDAASVRTEARPDGDAHVLSGTKRWITGGQVADLFLVFARDPQGVCAFLVPADSPGLHRRPMSDALGTRASMLAEIEFDDVRVGREYMVGRPGFGAVVMSGALDMGRYSVAAGCVGILQACLDESVAYTSERSQGGSLLREHQLVRRMVADMSTRAQSGRCLVERAGRLKDAGDPETVMATWTAKYATSTAAMQSATDAVQLHGANGCAGSATVNRLFRDAKVMEIIEGSSELQQMTIAGDAYRI